MEIERILSQDQLYGQDLMNYPECINGGLKVDLVQQSPGTMHYVPHDALNFPG
jgi:hypothetical protein